MKGCYCINNDSQIIVPAGVNRLFGTRLYYSNVGDSRFWRVGYVKDFSKERYHLGQGGLQQRRDRKGTRKDHKMLVVHSHTYLCIYHPTKITIVAGLSARLNPMEAYDG